MDNEKPKKPRKQRVKRFPGMKKQPAIGKQKRVGPKVYKPVTYKGRIKSGMTEYQKRTMSKFLEVREGETQKEWEKRTARRRVKTLDEINEMHLMSPVRIHQRNRERHAISAKNKFIKVEPIEREFDFMRYYGIVINYYSIRYDIRVEDFQMGFYFHSNIPFTRGRFENAAVLHYGVRNTIFNHFIKKGLMEELLHTKKVFGKDSVKESTKLFVLTIKFVDKLNRIYRTLAKMNKIRTTHSIVTGLSPEVLQIITDMNDHIMDIQTGRKPQEKLLNKNLDCIG